MEASLYIHIPFCASKCAYCDFHSRAVSFTSPEIDNYIEWLCGEITKKINRPFYKKKITKIPSIYIGGGTPSFLGAARIEKILTFITCGSFSALITKDCEITVEANPESIDDDFLRVCTENGVTRLSCGVQSFNDDVRHRVNRIGAAQIVKQKIALAKNYPISISCDLISGLPGQTKAILLHDIETLLHFEIPHISLYDLIPKENHILENEDEKVALYLAGRKALLNAGYENYEVSNFAKTQNVRSRHNVRYWRMENWLGAGEGASGTLIDDKKCRGLRETDGETETLFYDTLLKETFLMGFRFCEGPDEALFQKRFKKKICEVIPQTLKKWQDKKLMNKKFCALNENGLLFLNRFLSDCFLEISADNK